MNEVMKRNNVKIIGQGEQTIVFAHGFGCDQSMWRFIAPKFEENYRMIVFDYVGSGNSDVNAYCSEKYSTLQGYVQDVLDIIDELELENIIFIGHSISAMIGMKTSITRPEAFNQLIMIGPSPCYVNDTDGYFGGFEKSDILELLDMMEMNFTGWASYMAPIVMDTEHPVLTQEIETSFASGHPYIARQFAEVTFFSDQRASLSQVTVPTLIIQCSNDSIVPIEVGEYLHQHLKNSTFYLMHTKGHYPHISQPEETSEIILQYLVGVSK
ncbi:alpha/beta fold hydrolase [Lysinibacillus sp. LZ02]|uniref:alpha/beta fold hydrolase n=1 Tax=Lysinibacillus sp. LZ02 TaxID=3420668 RepID=UPI003D367724